MTRMTLTGVPPMTELKPCPFCGEEEDLEVICKEVEYCFPSETRPRLFRAGVRVRCSRCKMLLSDEGDPESTEKEAIERVLGTWNNRPGPTPDGVKARLERELFEANQKNCEITEEKYRLIGELQRDRSERERDLLDDIEGLQEEVKRLRSRRDELTSKLAATGEEVTDLKRIRVHDRILVDRHGTMWDPEGEVMPAPGPDKEDEKEYGPFADLRECFIYLPVTVA